MSRTDATVNRALDALVTLLGTIDGTTYPLLWLTTVKTVKRHSRDPLNEVRPALLVSLQKFSSEPQTALLHRATADFEVECIVNYSTAVDDPARDLHRLVADVIAVVGQNTQLSGVLTTGQIHVVDGYEPSKQFADVAGLASCVVSLRAEWEWSATNP